LWVLGHRLEYGVDRFPEPLIHRSRPRTYLAGLLALPS
jgi:hypothetical protein